MNEISGISKSIETESRFAAAGGGGGEEKIDHLIDEDRFDLFHYYLIVLMDTTVRAS